MRAATIAFFFLLIAPALPCKLLLGQAITPSEKQVPSEAPSRAELTFDFDLDSLIFELELVPAPPLTSRSARQIPDVEPAVETGLFIVEEMHPLQFQYEDLLFKLHSKTAKQLKEIALARYSQIGELESEKNRLEREIAAKRYELAKEIESQLTPIQLRKLTEARLNVPEEELRQRQLESLLRSALKKIQSSESVTFREGISRELNKLDLEKQIADGQLKKTGQYWFYKDPLMPSADMEAQLLAVCLNPKSYEPNGGGKFCGGFHPDLAITTGASYDQYGLLICLGCREILLIDQSINLSFDLSESAFERIEEIALKIFERRATKQAPKEK
jgi:hypothetical protein